MPSLHRKSRGIENDIRHIEKRRQVPGLGLDGTLDTLGVIVWRKGFILTLGV